MSENIPQSSVNPFVGVQKTAADAQAIKLVQVPPEAAAKGMIEGRVVAQENGRITIATEFGQAVIEAKIAAEIGQKIQVRLQLAAQKQADAALLKTLDMVSKTDKTAPPVSTSAPSTTGNIPDRVQAMPPVEMRVYDSLTTRLAALPQAVTQETFDLLVKTMLQLPMAKSLPQTLLEGFDKFKILSDLLVQARLVPQNTVQTEMQTGGLQNDMLSAMMRLLKPSVDGGVDAGRFWTQNPSSFLQLQSIAPGQSLSPNILLDIRQQLMNVLNPSVMAHIMQQNDPVSTASSGLGSLIKQTQGVLQNVMPDKWQSTMHTLLGTKSTSQSDSQKSYYTLPMTAMILGQVPVAAPQGGIIQNPLTLILMATPQGQNLIGYVLNGPADAGKPSPIIIPGTVMVVAMPPQTNAVLQMPSMIGMMPSIPLYGLQPLHPAFGQNWPALEALWDEALSGGMLPADAAVALHHIIPSTTPQQMTPALLLFMALIKGGLGDQWIDEKTQEALQKIGKENLLNQLSNDMRIMRQAMDDGPVDAWKPLPMPFQQNEQLMRVQWYYRHQFDDQQHGTELQEGVAKDRKTRFIVDVPQTRLGDVQIDGLVHDKVLDIVLRTEGPILAQAEKAIRERYHKALEISGIAGNVQFQSGRDHYVRV